MTISRGQMPRELYQTGTDPEAEKLAKMLNISVLEARRLLNSMEDTSFMQNEKPTMRGGGIASLTQRQQYGLGSIARAIKKPFKKAASAVKDFAQSDIGQIALAVAAPYALGPAFASAGLAGSVGGSAFLGNALRAGITNLALQGVTTGKFDLGNAARAGVIGGGITTGLQKSGFMPQGTETDTSSLDSESLDSALRAEQAGNILENPVVDAPTFNEAVALDNALRSEQVVNVPTEISRRTIRS
jgi:predicted transcriptional regulator